MKLAYEYLPSIGVARHDLVLLHGWGSNREIWRPVLACVRSWANVTLIDLPSCSWEQSGVAVEPFTLDELLNAIVNCAPSQACYVGWSLGGNLASELAARYPQRVSALLTVCSNPKFLATESWPGMDAAYFSRFYQSVEASKDKALKRFDSLQATGSVRQRMLQRQLSNIRKRINSDSLLTELELLAQLDTRQLLQDLRLPQQHLLTDKDALIPVDLIPVLSAWLGGNSQASVCSIENVSHAALLEVPAQIAGEIQEFLESSNLLYEQASRIVELDKQDISHSFSSAARSYDSVAELQRKVGIALLNSVQGFSGENKVVLDLGCGTGYFSASLAGLASNPTYIGVDLAEGMVSYAKNTTPGNRYWVAGDAENLPVASHSVDLIFSSLAIQWCSDLESVFAEFVRVLRPGGQCVFATLGPDTLKELRASWARVDQHKHINNFLPATELEHVAERFSSIRLAIRQEKFVMHYDAANELLRELKILGAHNVNKSRSRGLTSRARLRGMYAAYEEWRDAGKLPASYDVLFAVVKKLEAQ
ncbi:MAG: malonyl-ACP O-methyltransferase BioC [Halioglobus sp.]